MYIALKDINLSGHKYIIGDDIPEEAVVPNRAAALIRNGYIASHDDKNGDDNADTDNTKGIPVHLKKSGEDIFLHPDEAEAVFIILQENAEDAATILVEQDSRNVLEVIRELDSRKGVRAAAEASLKELDKKEIDKSEEEPDESAENVNDSEEDTGKGDTEQQKEAVG